MGLERRNMKKQKTHKKFLSKILLSMNGNNQKTDVTSVAEDVEKWKPFCIAEGNVKQRSCFGNCWIVL